MNQAPMLVACPGGMNVSKDIAPRPGNATVKKTTTTAAAGQVSTNGSRDSTRAAIPPEETRHATAAKKGITVTGTGKAIGNVTMTMRVGARMMPAMVGIGIMVNTDTAARVILNRMDIHSLGMW